MDEMTATFEPTPEVRELLEGKPAEYIVVNPVVVEAEFEDGSVVRYPQEIHERIVRCRDCKHCDITDFSGLIINGKVLDGPVTYACHGPMQVDGGGGSVEPYDFCSRGEERDE